MPTRFYRLLILSAIVLLLSLGRLIDTSGQAPANTNYLPIVSYNLTGWIGPYGGTIVSTLVDPTNPKVVYVATFGSGVFKSTDGGNSWFSINRGLSNLLTYSLAIDPSNPSTIYVGTYHSQVFKSSDGGVTWAWSGTGMQDPAIVYNITVDPVTPSVIYACTRGASNNSNPPWNGVIYKSINGGQSWTDSLTNVGGVKQQDWAYSLVVNPNNHQQVFAALHENGPFRSVDSGATWHSIHTGINDPSGRSISISPQPDYSSWLYYGVWHFDSVYKTFNSGDLWSGANQGIPNVEVYDTDIDPYSAKTLYVASFTDGILKTDDGGKSWLPSGLLSNSIYSISINPQRTFNLFAGTAADGLYRSNDSAVSWQRSNVGINNAMVTSVIHSPSNPQLIVSSIYGAGVFLSGNRGQAWEEINKGLNDKYIHTLAASPSQPSIVYALTESSGLYRNDLNSGDGWVKTGQGLPLVSSEQPAYPLDVPFATLEMLESFAYPSFTQGNNPQSIHPLLSMVFAPSNPDIAYLGTWGAGAYRSTNGGTSWIAAELGGLSVYSLAVDPVDPNTVYAATNAYGSMKISKDGGINWIDANLPAQLNSLAQSPGYPGVVYAGTNVGIYRYQAGSFSLLGLADKSVTAVALDSRRVGVIYAGTTAGAYFSTDSGVTWKSVDPQLNQQTILSITFDTVLSNVVYFSTKTHGTYLVAIQF